MNVPRSKSILRKQCPAVFASLMFVTSFALSACESDGDGTIAQSEALAPGGWNEVALSIVSDGIRFYENGQPDEYVVVIDMRIAAVRLLTGGLSPNPFDVGFRIDRLLPHEFVAMAENIYPGALKVVVGGTFGTFNQPTELAFGLKANDTLISDGYCEPGNVNQNCPGDMKVITFNNMANRAWVGPHNPDSFTVSPDLMGGLAVTVGVGANPNRRSMMGVRDDDNDGDFETVVVFTCENCPSQAHASNVLSTFGVTQDRKIMLDGSKSAFAYVDGDWKISSDRKIAQATVFYVP